MMDALRSVVLWLLAAMVGLGAASAPAEEMLIPGDPRADTISSAAQVRVYALPASAGDLLVILMTKVEGDLWPKITLRAPDGTVIATDTHPTTAEIATQRLPASGTYSLHCQDGFDGAGLGSFRITMMRFPYVASWEDPDGGPVRSGEVKAGSLAFGDLDGYTFAGAAGDVVSLLMVRVSGSAWPKAVLYGPDGVVLASESDPTNTRIESLRLSQAGTYFVLCQDGFNGTKTGDYHLSLTVVSAPPPAQVVPGDLDGDGRVGVRDALLALRVVSGLASLGTEQKLGADLDGSGRLDIRDVLAILRRAAGLS